MIISRAASALAFAALFPAAAPVLHAGDAAAGKPFFVTRGVVLVPDDLSWPRWPERAKEAGLTTIALHHGESPRKVAAFIGSERGKEFLRKCRELGLEVEYELHALRELLPRDLFEKEPGLFRMDEKGRRVPDANLCVRSERALEIAGRNAAALARVLRPTTHRYFLWGDDGQPWCRCPRCADLSDSDQALVFENSLLKALRAEDTAAQLAHLAYANTLVAPRKVKPAPGIFLEFAPISRRYDRAVDDAGDPECRKALEALEENLKVFGAEGAQALEYWLDASRFSGWKRPAVKVPFDEKVFRKDLDAYGSRGIRRVTTFAVFIDADYLSRHGEPPLGAYGAGLAGWKPR